MTRLAPTLLAVVAMIAFERIDAAPSEHDAALPPSGEIRFTGAVLEPAGIQSVVDVRSIASLPPGQVVRRGNANPEKHDPPRTVVVLPSREEGKRVVMINYD
jgi:hypothetical protein